MSHGAVSMASSHNTRMSFPVAPQTRADFQVAIICALGEEADAVLAVFDRNWSDAGISIKKPRGDSNAYAHGAIGQYNVVVVYLGEMGISAASVAATSLRSSYTRINLALVVGICGVVPSYGAGHGETQIWLGDIVISTAVVRYDNGRQFPSGFARKVALEDSLGRPRQEVRPLLAQLKSRHFRDKTTHDIAVYLDREQEDPKQYASYPGPTLDKLYHPSYLHEHHEANTKCGECKGEDVPCPRNCESLKCDEVIRRRDFSCPNCKADDVGNPPLRDSAQGDINNNDDSSVSDQQATLQNPLVPKLQHSHHPSIHFGRFGSANTVMRSGENRDDLARDANVIALEMEAAGVWDSFPTLVIKSACDYADSHKNKDWQKYAATTAAVCMRSVLGVWNDGDLHEFEDIDRAESHPNHRLGQSTEHFPDVYPHHTSLEAEHTRLNRKSTFRNTHGNMRSNRYGWSYSEDDGEEASVATDVPSWDGK